MSAYTATTTGFASGVERNTHTTNTAAPAVQTRGQHVHTSKKPMALLPMLGLAFAGWAVYTGGLAALQHQCPGAPAGNDAFLNGVDGFSSTVLPCSKVYRWSWFVMAFEIVIILGLSITIMMGRLWHARLAFLALFAIATLLFMLQTERFLTISSLGPYNSGGRFERRNWTTFSGALILVVANVLVILAMGIDAVIDHTAQSTEGYGHGHGNKV